LFVVSVIDADDVVSFISFAVEFIKLVKTEYLFMTKYKDYDIRLKSLNDNIIQENGKLNKNNLNNNILFELNVINKVTKVEEKVILSSIVNI